MQYYLMDQYSYKFIWKFQFVISLRDDFKMF